MQMRFTPENITTLDDNEIFVFGSNLAGRHGKGAAKTAMKWGAKYGQAEGLQGRTYGIPTVNEYITDKLDIREVRAFVDNFISFASFYSELNFLVTAIGTGLAGFTVEEIAPLFERCVTMENVYLPISFWKVLTPKEFFS
jgi:hypothetical protein